MPQAIFKADRWCSRALRGTGEFRLAGPAGRLDPADRRRPLARRPRAAGRAARPRPSNCTRGTPKWTSRAAAPSARSGTSFLPPGGNSANPAVLAGIGGALGLAEAAGRDRRPGRAAQAGRAAAHGRRHRGQAGQRSARPVQRGTAERESPQAVEKRYHEAIAAHGTRARRRVRISLAIFAGLVAVTASVIAAVVWMQMRAAQVDRDVTTVQQLFDDGNFDKAQSLIDQLTAQSPRSGGGPSRAGGRQQTCQAVQRRERAPARRSPGKWAIC